MEIDDVISVGSPTAALPPTAHAPSPATAPPPGTQPGANKPTKSSKRRARRKTRKSKLSAELMAQALAAPVQPGSPPRRLTLKLQRGPGPKISDPCQKVMVFLLDGPTLDSQARGKLEAAAAASFNGELRVVAEQKPAVRAGGKAGAA